MDRHLTEFNRALKQTLGSLQRQVRELQRQQHAGAHSRRAFVSGPIDAVAGSSRTVATITVDRGTWLIVAAAHHYNLGATAAQKFKMAVVPTSDTGGAIESSIPPAEQALPYTPNGTIDAEDDLHIVDVATFETPANLRLMLTVTGAATEWSNVRLVAVPL